MENKKSLEDMLLSLSSNFSLARLAHLIIII